MTLLKTRFRQHVVSGTWPLLCGCQSGSFRLTVIRKTEFQLRGADCIVLALYIYFTIHETDPSIPDLHLA